MAVSRKNQLNPQKASFLKDAFLSSPLHALFRSAKTPVYAIGVSGGADSAMLLVYAAHIASLYNIKIHAVHVHHGLQAIADEWVRHTRQLAQMLGVECSIEYVQVASTSGLGIEASARNARYRAYEDFAERTGIRHFLLAHHLYDQTETVLLRLLRGAGVQGMAAMAGHSQRGELHFYRPWLDVSRQNILEAEKQFFLETGWQAVHDPTNADSRYTRAAVREMLVPVLDERWHGWRGNLARHSRLMAENTLLLKDLAQIDYATLDASADNTRFSLQKWRELPMHRQANVLRYWLDLQHIPMPSEARLNEWMRQFRQLHQLGHDRNLKLKHARHEINVIKGWVSIRCVAENET
ncbi:MAG: tRNA lysidine(34) synthetase TilS [Alcaligenaceae bacterium]|nr:tRNA lysidine(34) synthetase TilS [Alcaligenaceae bacterium]